MLEEILSIPTFSGREELISNYVMSIARSKGYRVHTDAKKNVYMSKGELAEGESYPCVVAHLDTVHLDQIGLIDTDGRIELIESKSVSGKRSLKGVDPIRDVPTGIGGDNKCGVYIALKLMEEFDVMKAAFFVEEETGMHGSKQADDSFFKNVGYAIQFDAPTRNWFSAKLMGMPLWDEVFFGELKPLLDSFKVDNITHGDPFTDVLQIRKKYGICCAVFPTGYYNQHSRHEYVVPEETEECLALGIESVKILGKRKYPI